MFQNHILVFFVGRSEETKCGIGANSVVFEHMVYAQGSIRLPHSFVTFVELSSSVVLLTSAVNEH